MPNSRVVLALALATLALPGALAAQARAHPLDKLGWLAGCWELRRGPRVTLEMWMPPGGGLMLGASRTVNDTVLREFEQLRMGWSGDSLVYDAMPSGQASATFKGGQPGDSGFSVENRGHDFPQRIIYRRRGADSLITRIEGPGPNGTATRGIDFPMRRVSCG